MSARREGKGYTTALTVTIVVKVVGIVVWGGRRRDGLVVHAHGGFFSFLFFACSFLFLFSLSINLPKHLT